MRFITIVLAASALAAAADPPKVPRSAVQAIERGFDRKVASLDVSSPFDVLGLTRGVYLDGYGIVFSAEANLVITPISPFHPMPNEAGIIKLRERKLQRLAVLEEAMKQSLVEAAAALDTVPPDEQVVLAVTLFYRAFEHREGLPDQVIVRAPRRTLLEIRAGRAPESAIKVEER